MAPVIAYVPVYGQPDQPAPTTVAFAPYEGTTDDEGVNRYTYDFADGSPLLETTEGYVEHVFSSAGTFNVVITAYDFYGLSDSFTVPLTIKANQPPVLSGFDLYIPQEVAPALSSIEAGPYAQDSDGYIFQYEINWGDGTVIQSPTSYNEHIYTQVGDYNVSVRVQDDKGAWSNIITKDIPIVDGFEPEVDFAIITNSYVAPVNIIFDGNNLVEDIDNNIIGYSWDINGQLIQTAGPYIEYNFNLVGSQSVSLIVTDGSGNSVTKNKIFEVVPNLPPVANFELDTSDLEEFQVFGADARSYSTDPEGRNLQYSWDMGDGKTYSNDLIAHYYEEEGEYLIRLKVIDDAGNISIKDQIVSVKQHDQYAIRPLITSNDINGTVIGDLYLSAIDSSFKGLNYNSIKWFVNGTFFAEGLSVTVEDYIGDIDIILEIESSLGLIRSVSRSFTIQEKIEYVYTDLDIQLVGAETNKFNPLNVSLSFSVNDENIIYNSNESWIILNGNYLPKGEGESQVQFKEGLNEIRVSFDIGGQRYDLSLFSRTLF